jgi:hypothetical protein
VESSQQGFGQGAMLEQFVDPLRHLRRGFVGERDGQDGVGRNIPYLNEIRDAVGDHPRLTGTCAGKNQQGTIYGFDGGTLLRI